MFITTLKGNWMRFYLILYCYTKSNCRYWYCGQEGFPLAVCITANLGNTLTKDIIMLKKSQLWVSIIFLIALRIRLCTIHSRCFKAVSRTETGFFITLCRLCNSLALKQLQIQTHVIQKVVAEYSALSTTLSHIFIEDLHWSLKDLSFI